MAERPLEGARIGILVDQQYQVLEVWYPLLRFMEDGAKVELIGPERGKSYPSKEGYPATADVGIGEADARQYDAIVIPGGFAPDFMRRDDRMIAFVQQAVDAGIVIGAICHGVWMLCSTNGLKGRKATSFFAIRHDVMNAGAEWIDAEVVRDSNIITSRQPFDLPAFCTAIREAVRERRSA